MPVAAFFAGRSTEGEVALFVSLTYLWPVAGVVGGAAVAAALRYLALSAALYAGLRLALRDAPSADRLPIFREFARALSLRPQPDSTRPDASRPEGPDGEEPGKEGSQTDVIVLRTEPEGTSRYSWLGRSRN
jgi:hypothetical protein